MGETILGIESVNYDSNTRLSGGITLPSGPGIVLGIQLDFGQRVDQLANTTHQTSSLQSVTIAGNTHEFEMVSRISAHKPKGESFALGVRYNPRPLQDSLGLPQLGGKNTNLAFSGGIAFGSQQTSLGVEIGATLSGVPGLETVVAAEAGHLGSKVWLQNIAVNDAPNAASEINNDPIPDPPSVGLLHGMAARNSVPAVTETPATKPTAEAQPESQDSTEPPQPQTIESDDLGAAPTVASLDQNSSSANDQAVTPTVETTETEPNSQDGAEQSHPQSVKSEDLGSIPTVASLDQNSSSINDQAATVETSETEQNSQGYTEQSQPETIQSDELGTMPSVASLDTASPEADKRPVPVATEIDPTAEAVPVTSLSTQNIADSP